MCRSLLLSALVLTIALWALGCGGSELTKNAAPAKPADAGDPAALAMGATEISGGTVIVLKYDNNGETRISAFANRTPGKNPGPLKWDDTAKQFYDKSRELKFDAKGLSLGTIPKGPNAGQPRLPLNMRVVSKDPANGHLLVSAKTVPVEGRDDATKGAYVTVQ